MPLPDLTTLTPAEQQTLLVQLLRLVAQTGGPEAIHAALQSCYTTSESLPEPPPIAPSDDQPTEADIKAADEYIKTIRQRIEAKYGSTDVPE